MFAAGPALAGTHSSQELRCIARAGHFRPRAADPPQRMRVAAGNDANRARARVLLNQRVLLREHRAVATFERRRQVHDAQVRRQRQLVAIKVQR